jgi:hypothetical protein
MSDMFEHASKVAIGLGRGLKGTNYRVPTRFIDMKLVQEAHHEKGKLVLQPPSSVELEVFDMLFSQPYWTRLWIIQEIMLAKTLLICLGQHYLDWDELYEYSSAQVLIRAGHSITLPTQQALVTRTAVQLLVIYRYWKSQGVERNNKYSWQVLLPDYAALECEQPHDKIYLLNALVVPKERLTIDYTQPASYLFWDVMDMVMHNGWAGVLYIDWMIPLGLHMGVDGTEGNARTFTNAHISMYTLKFSWPQGFREVEESEATVSRKFWIDPLGKDMCDAQ